jgi:hypothetical protein
VRLQPAAAAMVQSLALARLRKLLGTSVQSFVLANLRTLIETIGRYQSSMVAAPQTSDVCLMMKSGLSTSTRLERGGRAIRVRKRRGAKMKEELLDIAGAGAEGQAGDSSRVPITEHGVHEDTRIGILDPGKHG